MSPTSREPRGVALHRPRYMWLWGTFWAFFALGLGIALPLTALGLAVVPEEFLPGEIPDWLAPVLVVAGIAVFVLGIQMIRIALRPHVSLWIEGDRLVVDNPALFRKPLEIPASRIAVASVDRQPDLKRWEPRASRFFFEGRVGLNLPRKRHSAAATTALYSMNTILALPSLSEPNVPPNVVVLFREPIRLGPRRWLAWSKPLHGRLPRRRARERGFWVTARDPQAAHDELAKALPLRPLVAADAEVAFPSPPEVKRAQRRRYALVTIVVLATLAPVVAGAALSDGDDQATACEIADGATVLAPTGVSAQESAEPIERIGNVTVPPGATVVREGMLDAQAVADRHADHFGGRLNQLTANGFQRAYVREWTLGSTEFSVEAIDFLVAQGAHDYARWNLLDGCFLKSPIRVPEVEQAVGMRFNEISGDYAEVTFTRGRRLITVSYWERSGKIDRDALSDLAEQAEALAT